jgi:hypothetical protein
MPSPQARRHATPPRHRHYNNNLFCRYHLFGLYKGYKGSNAELNALIGSDEKDLLRWCTAVTLVLQTKPWFREVDL